MKLLEKKFKVWSIDDERWCEDSGTLMHTNGSGLASNHPELYIIVQYIGLKDKNGEEIYEGDIIRLDSFSFTGNIRIIKWDEEECGFQPFTETLCGSGEDDDDVGNMKPLAGEWCEILGNIYENPKLKEKF